MRTTQLSLESLAQLEHKLQTELDIASEITAVNAKADVASETTEFQKFETR